ncbi:MAG TPA: helix-turn-helix transcriptional regulator [Xanthobacteraceae bacterium]|nr:helix-turn-helix transcriptional regulator [Xanthobacteraceae bacterium]
MTAAEAKESRPIVGSGDFLADRGYLDPDEMRLKFALANEIALIVEQRGLKQTEVAKLAELAQSDVSRIVNGIVKDYSVYRLMRVVTKLGKNVSIDFTDASAGQGVIFAAERTSEYTPEPSR